jgi:hypothetical protein
MIPITLGLTASEARVQPPWHGTPFPQSRMPASIEFSIKLFVCIDGARGIETVEQELTLSLPCIRGTVSTEIHQLALTDGREAS